MGRDHQMILPGNGQLKKVDIHIGEYFASREPVVITTFLGSCVAVCLFDRKNKVGGMNHILVPGKASFQEFNAPARFSINAMELLINAMMKLGGEKQKLNAKVFGGANVIPGLPHVNSVGSKISEFVLEFLAHEHIPVMGQDLGGHKSRKVFFHTDTGNVYLRRSHSMKSSHLAVLEQKKLIRISKQLEKKTDVVIFDQPV
ncbi:MAG: chemotaxis protein CheD [Proteobacteria bacterium]|nr:chemotaxis protein CheD [Pseudomonadota bacterium]